MLIRRAVFLTSVVAVSVLVTACGAGSGSEAQPQATVAAGISLPPAWTATPSATVVPPTETPTPTSIPLEVPREIVSTLGTPLPTAFALAAAPDTVDRTGWKRVDATSAFLFMPATFEVVDMGPMGEAMVEMMEVFAKGMVEAFSGLVTPVPGASPTPPFEELEDFSIDLLMAADPARETAIFIVGEPRPEAADLQSMLVKAIDDINGKTEVLSTELIEGHTYPMGRAVVRVRDEETGRLGQQALYVILHGQRAWTLSCQSLPGDFAEMLPVFDSVARSLEPKS
jgi:hypothetical protein